MATDFDGGFPIKSFDAEFVVLVALNRDYRYRKAKMITDEDDGSRDPDFFVLPMPVVKPVAETAPQWGSSAKVDTRRRIDNWQQYQSAWHLVLDYLGTEANAASDTTAP